MPGLATRTNYERSLEDHHSPLPRLGLRAGGRGGRERPEGGRSNDIVSRLRIGLDSPLRSGDRRRTRPCLERLRHCHSLDLVDSLPSALGPRWRDWGEFEHDFLASLWQQASYLRDHLEWDLRANHLMRDAVGLAWAGRFFEETQAREWLQTATRLAVEQAEEQKI